MVSSGYGVETTVESIWTVAWDTTKFDHWNALIGTKFNAAITQAAGTDIANTDVIEELRAETHLIFAEVDAMAKISTMVNPWDFMNQYASLHLLGNNFKMRFSDVIKRCQKLLNKSKTIEIVDGVTL